MAPGTTFVHDFAGIDCPVEAVLGAIHDTMSSESVRDLVLRAWFEEALALGSGERHDSDEQDDTRRDLQVETGPARVRRDATVVPVTWSGGEQSGLPPLEADLEFTAFGDDRTHVHLYGRSAISEVADPMSRRGSLTNRVAVAVVRRFLSELVAALATAASESKVS